MQIEAQRSIAIALDPAQSVVVEACAGSGKTWLLVSRIVRLLLDGVAPGEILAITYTRKAANQLTARLRAWLRVLALEDDATVRAFLGERGLPPVEIERLMQASRRLLEQHLSAQPALTINTFHGWFLDVLRRAPLDAGVAGSSALIEKTSQLVDEAWHSFASGADEHLIDALDYLFEHCRLSNTERLLKAILNRRAEWWTFSAGHRDPLDFALTALRKDLDIDPDADLSQILMTDASFVQQTRRLAEAFRRGSESNQRLADRLTQLLALPPREARAALVKALMTDPGRANLIVAKAADKLGVGEVLYEITDRLLKLLGQEADQGAWRFNAAALRCGVAMIDQYQRLKAMRDGVDFADVEWRTWKLLTRSDHAEYLQYKLDARYRHILLDEFQDVNPLQWQILESWIKAAHEAGVGPRLFIVGDPKQSIYRFRRAESRLFVQVANYLAQSRRAARLTLSVSWRSAPLIMEVVNRVFAQKMEGFTLHSAQVADLPGRVELLPLARVDDATAVGAGTKLRNPLDEARSDVEVAAREIEASAIATRIGNIVGHWELRASGETHGRRARYVDIMMLVRSRTHLPVYERALRAAGIPFVSSRRGGLLDAPEIADLTALLRFLITPFSDLDLALALRSPVFSCSDADLILLAQGAGSWWWRLSTISAAGKASPALCRAHELIAEWLSVTDRLPVHDLLDRIYFGADVLNRYQASVPEAMRPSVNGNLVALIELALAVDAGRYPSLPRFLDELARMREGAAQDAPDEGFLANDGDAVRILTVHGAKGLEAPVVFIIDANGVEMPDRGYDVLLDWPPEAARPTHFSVYGKGQDRGVARRPLFEAEEAQARQEEINALYVAMTRAKQALIISGSQRRKGASAPSWYGSIREALQLGDEGDATGDDLCASARPSETTPQVRPLDSHAVDPRMQRPLNIGRREVSFSSAQTRHGERVHRLLQFMAAPQSVTDLNWLRETLACAEDEFQAAVETAQSILQAESLRRFFDPAQYRWAANEWPIMVDGEARRIDRVVESIDEVWVLDYKSGETVAAGTLESVAASHAAQLERYRWAVAQLLPAKPTRSALIFAPGQLHVMV